MEIFKINCQANDLISDAAKAEKHKLCYSAPILINYGLVNIFTQGNSSTGSDIGTSSSKRN